MLRTVFANTRYLILIPIVGSLVASVILLVFGAFNVVQIAVDVVTHVPTVGTGAKQLAVKEIEIIDLFLLGTVFYIVAIGLYELFIDDSIPVLPWLIVRTLDDLKAKLVGVVIVLLAVTFLSNIVSWDGTTTILYLGGAVGFVLFALSYHLSLTRNKSQKKEQLED